MGSSWSLYFVKFVNAGLSRTAFATPALTAAERNGQPLARNLYGTVPAGATSVRPPALPTARAASSLSLEEEEAPRVRREAEGERRLGAERHPHQRTHQLEHPQLALRRRARVEYHSTSDCERTPRTRRPRRRERQRPADQRPEQTRDLYLGSRVVVYDA